MSKNDFSAFSAATGASSNGAPDVLPERFLRRTAVCEATTLPSSSLTDLIAKGDFPAPYKLSERSSAWKLSEVMEWINSRQKAV